MRVLAVVMMIGAGLLAAPAVAQVTNSYNDPVPGAASLVGSNFSEAEREIRASGLAQKNDPAAAINLGIALAKQGQKDRAAELFNNVLLQDNVEMTVASGRTAMSHDLARYALSSLNDGVLSR